MHVRHVATAQATDAPRTCASLRTRSALEHVIPSTSAKEVHRSQRVAQLRCPGAVPESRCVTVFLSAYRLTKAHLTSQSLPSSLAKNAFAFHEDDGEEDSGAGFAFGSREGEYCLLRIRIENALPHQPVPIDRVIGVQMLSQTGHALPLKTAAWQTRSLCKEILVLLDPTALQSGVAYRWPMEKTTKRDRRLELHIQVWSAHSGRQEDIVKTLYWRTMPHVQSSICQERWPCRQKCVSLVMGTKSYSRFSRGEDVKEHAEKVFQFCRRFRNRSSLEVSWQHVLNATHENRRRVQ